MASLFTLINLLLLSQTLLFFSSQLNVAYVYAAATDHYNVIDPNWLLPNSNCSTSTGGSTVGSQKLQVTNRYGPCSPIGKGKEIPTSDQILLHDTTRVHSMNGRMSQLHLHPTAENDNTISNSFRSIGNGIYVVTIGFGTPKRDYNVIFDTGSDITWIQCQPCSQSCYSQHEPLFDPSLSSSYSKGSCKSYNTDNQYLIQYADGSYSSGLFGCDTLTLEPSDVITNFQFGCAQNSSNGFGAAAGMLGLGQGELALVSQTASKFGKTFRYCLPTPTSSHGYLLFGDHAKSSSSLKFTPLITKPNSPYYFLKLVGITIAGKRLNISPFVFKSQGTIIDSGTVITRLPISAYSELRSAFRQLMSRYHSAPPSELLDTCYDLSGHKKVSIPKIVLHFGGGTRVNLQPSGIVWPESQTRVCLAFAAKEIDSDLTIIGNNQQQGLDVFYDIKAKKVGFSTTGCTN